MTLTLKRPRKDSKLDALTAEQQQQLTGWLVARMDYGAVLKLIEEAFGVKTSIATLSRYYKKYVGPFLIEKRRAAVGVADAVEAEARKRPDLFDAAAIRNLRERAFTMSCDPSADTGEVLDVFRVLLKREELDQDKAKSAEDHRLKAASLALDRQRFQFDAVKSVMAHADLVRELSTTPGLSDDEKTQRLGQAIFGEEWAAT